MHHGPSSLPNQRGVEQLFLFVHYWILVSIYQWNGSFHLHHKQVAHNTFLIVPHEQLLPSSSFSVFEVQFRYKLEYHQSNNHWAIWNINYQTYLELSQNTSTCCLNDELESLEHLYTKRGFQDFHYQCTHLPRLLNALPLMLPLHQP